MQANVSDPLEKRIANAIALLKMARREHGRGIYLLPEYFLVDFLPDRAEMVGQAEDVPGPSTDPFMAFAREAGVFVGVGLFHRSADPDRPYNAIALFGPEGFVGCYHKAHLWDSGNLEKNPAKEEFLLFTPGHELGLYEMYGHTVGVMVCADGTFPEFPRELVLNGADLLLWPNGRNVVGAEAETTAKANLAPIVVSNLLGDNGTAGGGSSRVVGPWGEVLASAVGVGYSPHGTARGEGWAAAELDMGYITGLKDRYHERRGRRPELYRTVAEKT